MAKEYICTGFGENKETGDKYYTVAPIFKGVTKDGRRFGMIQNDQRMSVDDPMEIGEIRSFSLIAD